MVANAGNSGGDCVVDQKWENDSSTVKDRFRYGYDRGSNRTYRENVLSGSRGEKYDYDGLARLEAATRGTLSGSFGDGFTGVTAANFAQQWSLSGTGNWAGFKRE